MGGEAVTTLLDLMACPSRELQAQAFHRKHPEVWALFCQFTREKIARGARRIGAKAVWERIRWETGAGDNEGAPKLNNNFTASYARWFQAMYPQHAGVFRTRGRE